jgi:type VI secretion system secreted protein Hcp
VGNALGGERAVSGSAHTSTLTAKLTPAQLLATATTATGIHLRYAGITTGPLLPTHDNDIQIQSFQFGTSRSISSAAGGAARTAGTANVSEISLTHQTDTFSLALLRAALKGPTPGVTAQLYFTNLSGTGGAPLDYLEIDLGQTLVSSFSMSSGGDTPSESISLNFVTMTFRYQVAGSPVQMVSYNQATGS